MLGYPRGVFLAKILPNRTVLQEQYNTAILQLLGIKSTGQP